MTNSSRSELNVKVAKIEAATSPQEFVAAADDVRAPRCGPERAGMDPGLTCAASRAQIAVWVIGNGKLQGSWGGAAAPARPPHMILMYPDSGASRMTLSCSAA